MFGLGFGFGGGVGFVPPGDVTPPSLLSAAVSSNGQALTLTYSEALDPLSVPATSAYALAGTVASVFAVNVIGSTVVLSLSPAAHDVEVVTVSYTVPGSGKVRDAAGNNAAALTNQAVTNGSTNTVPLGDAFWSLYIDARDYEASLSSGDVLGAALTPRVGSGAVTPVNSPTVSGGALGIGNRLAFRTQVATSQAFNANWLASIMNGSKKTATIAIRGRRTNAANAVWTGFGKAASAVNSFFEILVGAVPVVTMRKNDGTTTATKSGATNIGSNTTTLIITTSPDGDSGYLYVDGVLEAAFSTPLDMSALASVVIDQFRIGNSGRNSTPQGGGLDGYWQICAVSANTVDATQAAAIHAAFTSQDVATSAGAQVYFVGDSLTLAEGMRKAVYDYYTTHSPALNIDMVGSFSGGSFGPDNQHSAVNGAEIAGIISRTLSEVGSGKAFPSVKLVHLLGCVNDLNNVGVDVSAIETTYSNGITSIHDAITAVTATARISLTTIPPLQPGTQGDTQVTSFNSWLRDTFVPAWNAAHPSNQILFWDLELALGGAWNALYYLDSVHLNATGWALACAHGTYGLIPTISAYLESIG